MDKPKKDAQDKKKEPEVVVEEQEEKSEVVEEKIHDEHEEKITELEAKWKRALADYQNLENRMRDQRSEWIKAANKDLLLRLLPILDTLQLAYQHTKDQTLQVSTNQFLDILKTEGVIKIDTVGKDFDPMSMECIVTDAGKENKVLEELRSGFMLHDKVLRPAQVKVGNGEKKE